MITSSIIICAHTDNPLLVKILEKSQSASTSAVADPDLQKSGGGPGHPDPEIRGRGWGGAVLGAGLTKKIFWPLGPQYKGVPPLLSLPWIFLGAKICV